MAGSKTSEFPASGESPDANDLIAFVDVSQGTNETMTVSQLAAADSFTSLAAAVDSVNAQTGAVVLDADDIDDAATTNKFATAAQLAAVDALGTLAAQNDIVVPADITATGTPDATTYLRGDGSWATPGGSSDAADINVVDTAGYYTATNVETALAEVKLVADTAAGGGVTLEQVQDDLGNTSLVAGTSLTKVYDDTAGTITLNVDAADFATATALSDHIADTADAHDASAISVLDTATQYTATDVEAALAEVKVIADAAVTPGEAAAAYQPINAFGWTYIDSISNEAGASVSTLTMSGIPEYDQYRLTCSKMKSRVGVGVRGLSVNFNGDTGTNYVANASTGQTTIKVGEFPDGANSTYAGHGFAQVIVSRSAANVVVVSLWSGGATQTVQTFSGSWLSAAPITSITFTGFNSWATESMFVVEGRNNP